MTSSTSAGGRAFAELDRHLAQVDAQGGLVVTVESSTVDALAQHLARRARGVGRSVLEQSGRGVDDVFRALSAGLGLTPTSDAVLCAQQIIGVLGGGVLIVSTPRITQWSWEVSRELIELSALGGSALVVVMTSERPPTAPPKSAVFYEVPAVVSAEEVRRWWGAVTTDCPLPDRADRLAALEQWWSVARHTPSGAEPQAPPLSDHARRLLGKLQAARCTLSFEDVERFEPQQALEELTRAGLVRIDARQRWGVTRESFVVDLAVTLSPLELAEVAYAVEGSAAGDPWASARASELFVGAGELEMAESASVRALLGVTNQASREDFWLRWDRSIQSLPQVQQVPRWLRAAELALRLGDVERALSFARAAAAVPTRDAATDFQATLALGRATAARGDLTTACITLEKALDIAPRAGARARAAVELSEAHYAAGDLARAKEYAMRALDDAEDLSTKLLARNVVGKLLLANADWEEAELHFAADASEAACGNDPVAELRARLNRGIALFSSGRLDEARSILLSVLEDAERRHELRATSFALANLAALAILRHDYIEALSLSERAINVRRRIGEKIGLARLITNLAELRLRLGMVVEAEQALAFGRSACGSGMPGVRLAHFALVAARIHLARGKTTEAAGEISAALAGATGSSDGAMLGECHRVAARIALEDGDVLRAEVSIAKARETAVNDRARAEVLLLEAQRARAAGEPFAAFATEALALAQVVDDDELGREAHFLAHLSSVAVGESEERTTHLDAAIAMRNRVADALPEPMRTTFMARRDLRELAQLESRVALSSVEHELRPGASGTPKAASAVMRMVGDDPSIMALKAAIGKVGPSDAIVFIHGESGTGKELVAEALHEASPRRDGPMVKVNCAALVETLLLSELFGHEKGSFTGAVGRRRGRFELAEGGTLFLDEIGDISGRTQVALLRVLQDRTFERVGGVTPIRANVRVICASHRDLKAMVAAGEFREDLYYRLRGVILDVPPLRERMVDLPKICDALLERIAAERGVSRKVLSERAHRALCRHRWPGNIRELENALRAAALFSEGDLIEPEDFVNNVDGLRDLLSLDAPPTLRAMQGEAAGHGRDSMRPEPLSSGIQSYAPPPLSSDLSGAGDSSAPASNGGDPTQLAYAQVRGGVSLAEMKRLIERECIARALADSDGNITKAATLLGMKRPRLSQLVKQYELAVREGGPGSEESSL